MHEDVSCRSCVITTSRFNFHHMPRRSIAADAATAILLPYQRWMNEVSWVAWRSRLMRRAKSTEWWLWSVRLDRYSGCMHHKRLTWKDLMHRLTIRHRRAVLLLVWRYLKVAHDEYFKSSPPELSEASILGWTKLDKAELAYQKICIQQLSFTNTAMSLRDVSHPPSDSATIAKSNVGILNYLLPLIYGHTKGSNNHILQSRVRPRIP